jgi:hypothetical protein
VAKQDLPQRGGQFQDIGDDYFVVQDITQSDRILIRRDSSPDEEYTLENLPDEYRKTLPPELINQIRQGRLETPGALQKNDPTFDGFALVQRASTIIGAVRDAEQNGQWDMVRPFMSQRFFRRWQPWAQGLQRSGSARPTHLTRQIAIAWVQSEAAYDRVTVRISESSVPPMQPPVNTIWTFLRSAAGRSGHQTQTSAAVCTNCGAPVDATNQPNCRYCGAGVASLGPEWVLDDVSADTTPSSRAA